MGNRPGDLRRLADSYLGFFARRLGKNVRQFSPSVLAAFAGYAWPGNLRELRNVIERAVILADGDAITLADLPEEFSRQPDTTVQVGAAIASGSPVPPAFSPWR